MEGVLLGTDEELGRRYPSASTTMGDQDLCTRRYQEGQRVSRRAGSPEVASDGGHGTDLRRADSAGCLTEATMGGGLESAKGHTCTDEAVRHLRQIGDSPRRDDHLWTAMVQIHLDHHIRPAGEKECVGLCGKKVECLTQGLGSVHLQATGSFPGRDNLVACLQGPIAT